MADTKSFHCVSSVNGTDDREAHLKYWIAAYTRPRSEKKVASELAKINICINTYVATQVIVKQWSDRKKKIESVVIPMVVFIEVSTEEEILAIKKHPLVVKILTLPGQKNPVRIPSKQIEQLRFMLNETNEPVEFVSKDFKVADTVRIIRGPLRGLEGLVERNDDGTTYIVLTIDMIGGAKVSINSCDIELCNQNRY